jgi:hypothetical protein
MDQLARVNQCDVELGLKQFGGMSTYVVPKVLGWHNSKLREMVAVCVHYQ